MISGLAHRITVPLLKAAFIVELTGGGLTVIAPHARFSAVILAVGVALFAVGVAVHAVHTRRFVWGLMSVGAVAGAVLVLVSADMRPRGNLAVVAGLIAILLFAAWRTGALRDERGRGACGGLPRRAMMRG